MNENLNNLINEIKNIKLVGEEADIYKLFSNLANKYNYAANTVDFDFVRIYNKGYEDKENWDEEYLFSIDVHYKPVNEDLYEITCTITEI